MVTSLSGVDATSLRINEFILVLRSGCLEQARVRAVEGEVSVGTIKDKNLLIVPSDTWWTVTRENKDAKENSENKDDEEVLDFTKPPDREAKEGSKECRLDLVSSNNIQQSDDKKVDSKDNAPQQGPFSPGLFNGPNQAPRHGRFATWTQVYSYCSHFALVGWRGMYHATKE